MFFTATDISLQELLNTANPFEHMRMCTNNIENQRATVIGEELVRTYIKNALNVMVCPDRSSCPAEGKVSNKSSKTNHFAKCCKTRFLNVNNKIIIVEIKILDH